MTLCSCSDDIQPDTSGFVVPDGTPVEIVAAAEFPEMNFGSSSRAMGDQPTANELLNSLKVNLLVFDDAGIMLQFISPTDISIERIDEAAQKVYFRVSNIYSSSQPRRLHFVVSSAPDIRELEGGELITAMANETTVMPALMSEGDTDVYWGLSELLNITNDMTLEMRVIRNFVKLSVRNSDTGDFKMTGYTVVNRPGKGTIAPYIYKDHIFASFLSPDNATLKSYDEIIAQGYHGVNPTGSEASMTHTTLAEVQASLAESERKLAVPGNDSPYFFYERSQSDMATGGSSTAVTYIIVKGELKGTVYYYKIDIGHNVDGDFKFFDLLRNFHYTVDVTEVGGPGATTLEDAMKGVAHNNISASVVTRDLFSISYHREIIEVSDTRVIFTEQTANYKLRFRYTVPAGLDYTFDSANLKIYDMSSEENTHYNMSTMGNIALGGEVIESASLSQGTDGWYVLNITTNNIPTDASRKEQTLRVYYSGGTTNLSRTITLMLRKPWLLTDVTSTVPTTGRNSEFSVKFTVPPGLVSSQFPLILTLESDKQNMYAQKGTDLHVAVGKSGFKGATTDSIMLYEWNIPWSQYDAENGKEYTATFLTNTTSAEDKSYITSGIDAATNGKRETNNNSYKFCIRIANKGQKYIEPYYVNITRPQK